MRSHISVKNRMNRPTGCPSSVLCARGGSWSRFGAAWGAATLLTEGSSDTTARPYHSAPRVDRRLPGRVPGPAGAEHERLLCALETRRAPARNVQLEPARAGARAAFDADALLGGKGQTHAERGRLDPK